MTCDHLWLPRGVLEHVYPVDECVLCGAWWVKPVDGAPDPHDLLVAAGLTILEEVDGES